MIEHMLTNLRVISKVQPKDKLGIHNSVMYISSPGYQSSLKRIFLRQNRTDAMFFISSLFKSTFEYAHSIMASVLNIKEIEKNAYPPFMQDYCARAQLNSESDLRGIFEEIARSRTGLSNLKTSYEKDATTISQIEVILQNIENEITAIQKFYNT
jgi:hypothetical protein